VSDWLRSPFVIVVVIVTIAALLFFVFGRMIVLQQRVAKVEDQPALTEDTARDMIRNEVHTATQKALEQQQQQQQHGAERMWQQQQQQQHAQMQMQGRIPPPQQPQIPQTQTTQTHRAQNAQYVPGVSSAVPSVSQMQEPPTLNVALPKRRWAGAGGAGAGEAERDVETQPPSPGNDAPQMKTDEAPESVPALAVIKTEKTEKTETETDDIPLPVPRPLAPVPAALVPAPAVSPALVKSEKASSDGTQVHKRTERPLTLARSQLCEKTKATHKTEKEGEIAQATPDETTRNTLQMSDVSPDDNQNDVVCMNGVEIPAMLATAILDFPDGPGNANKDEDENTSKSPKPAKAKAKSKKQK
jgi:uncharacterized protein YneF (UPF0154 family)